MIEVIRIYPCEECEKDTEHECFHDPPSFMQAKFIRCRICGYERQLPKKLEDYSW